ncbi:MAG: CRTAC1 family protein [Deltaproteobacteria bacterium]|nr:CRTAC1 family protein [Deltaproteobacteria bacterium]
MKNLPPKDRTGAARAQGDQAQGNDELEEFPEVGPQDDAVIGRAFKGSLVVLGGFAVLAVLGYLWTQRTREVSPEQVISPETPEAVTQESTAPTIAFTEITEAAGISFRQFNGAYGDKLLPETMGSGAAFLDYDGDGDQDLLLVNATRWAWAPSAEAGSGPALYENDGVGGFSDVSEQTGVDSPLYGTGVAVGDYDGDGHVDLFLGAVGGNRLLRNQDGVFEDVTSRAGVGGDPQEWSTSAAFFDYDQDGDLDLFVCNYVQWTKEIDFELDFRLTGVGRAYGPPQSYQGTFPYLYRNEGDGTFLDVSQQSGIQVVNSATGVPIAKSLALAPVDVDGDGWMDLLISNDTVQNFFYRNKGDGTFEEVGEYFGFAYDRNGNATGAMGVDSAYYRNDHNLGFFVGNFANEMSSVYVSQDDPSFFVDDSISEGIGAPSRLRLTFGLFLFDYDLDGRLDLLQANGHLEEEIETVDPSQKYRQSPQLFWNAGPDEGFVLMESKESDFDQAIVGRGATYGDIDGDGDLDVLLTQVAGPPLLLRNDQSLGHHWLRVSLVGGSGNRDAIGAWVEVEAGGLTQRRQVMPSRSYLSQVELPLTFGLGSSSIVDRLEVVWPDGHRQKVNPDGVDRLLSIRREATP